MNRDAMLHHIRSRRRPWDIAIIGGGATGMGVALDAAARGLSVVLVEAHDFGKGTSSRSTKLIHGGVRYLQQGNLSLVTSALRERGLLLRNAPHLVHPLQLLLPNYAWWEKPFYGIGLKLYDLLASGGFAPSRILNRPAALQCVPGLQPQGLRGGIAYFDGQFDDARLLIALALTASQHGAALVNYCPAIALLRDPRGRVHGLTARDSETGEELAIEAKVVINATGVFTDDLRRLADPAAPPLLVASQGIHLVFPKTFLGGDSAIIVPRTPDGRVLFVIPWHGHVLAGTTDTPVARPSAEPRALGAEIDFVLETAGRYLARRPTRADVLSVFAGLRPLVLPPSGRGKTSRLSRDHLLHLDASGLLTITGGKWTTYRQMAEDTVNRAIALAGLRPLPCPTRTLALHGAIPNANQFGALRVYGSDAPAIQALAAQEPSLGMRLHRELPILGAEIVWAARHEMARTIEDALARRTRALFLNARAAIAMAAPAARLLARELGRDPAWFDAQIQAFRQLAENYQLHT